MRLSSRRAKALSKFALRLLLKLLIRGTDKVSVESQTERIESLFNQVDPIKGTDEDTRMLFTNVKHAKFAERQAVV